MAKNYFYECKAIINSVLDYLKRSDQFDEKHYYTIDILDVNDDNAKVMVCNDCMYLAKEEGTWMPVTAPEQA